MSANYSVARIEKRTRENVTKFERHIERKNENYANMNVDISKSHMNVYFRSCGDKTYNEKLDEMITEGKVSLRGLGKNAAVFDEMILDVNTYYFEQNGGYEYAKAFYEEAFRFAEKIYGKEYILSAVMHADEINLWLSEVLDHPVYHYHMHVIALPVVEKEIRWSKRCKDKTLVGKVKETVMQVSHSKKWRSEKALDEYGKPILNSKGKPVYRTSYSILQDKFFEHMRNAGFEGFERGERGSDTVHQTVLQYQIEKDKERLEEIEQRISEANKNLEEVEPVSTEIKDIDGIGKKTLLGKIQMREEDYEHLSSLAKECISNRYTISKLEERVSSYSRELASVKEELRNLKGKCRPFLEALKVAPTKVMEFLERIMKPVRQKEREIEEAKRSPWEIEIKPRKPEPELQHKQVPAKKKNRGGYER